MLKIKLTDKRFIGENQPCFIIAETGINHNGDMALAKRMIDAAKDCRVDAVKFQTFKAEEFISDRNQTYTYRTQGRIVRESMYEMFKRYEFNKKEFAELAGYCRKKRIIFLSTPQNLPDLEVLLEIGIPAVKVGSDDLTNIPLLEAYAKVGLPMIVSTGMAYLPEISAAVKTISRFNRELALLHCVSSYPAELKEVNLCRLGSLKLKFPGTVIGYSDHTMGAIVPFAAAAMGAKIIEKHFTLDRDLLGPDHRFSAEPGELKVLVAGIRDIERAFGEPEFRPSANEQKMRLSCRRSVVAARNILKGSLITMNDLVFKRPGIGIPPGQVNSVVDRKALVNIAKDHLIRKEEISKNAG